MNSELLESRRLTSFRRRLFRWFASQQRDLPWRQNRDPYRIWVSEVMLQQTTVATVIPRFERFLTQFPTLSALANADEQEVLRSWEGLGYYRRARDLHRSAKLLVEQGGMLPDDPDVWRELPGVGRYILGAVLSQAFDRPMPIVEANTLRVLSRLFARRDDPTSTPMRKWLWEAAEALVPRKNAGTFNQAMMELGALVCMPSSPRCDECPVAADCGSFQAGLQNEIPAKAPRTVAEQVREVAVVVRDGSKALLVQRPATGRWARMWEFPHTTLEKKETLEHAARRLLTETLGIKATLGPEIMTIRHAVTRFRITMVCLDAQFRSGKIGDEHYLDARWLEPAEWASYPVSTPQRQLADELAKQSRQLRLF
ncbi:MAG: A/G-specific adenine glycosylase [Planctomycetes bacterium]|nr:A/G-specific adenine glycosylase [Planctomycetota bacterium]